MNLFTINRWLLLFGFTVPALVFSQVPAVLSALYGGFFLLYFFSLRHLGNEDNEYYKRNLIEAGLLALFFIGFAVLFLLKIDVGWKDWSSFVFRIIYFAVIFDLSKGFVKCFLEDRTEFRAAFYRIVLCLCFIAPPLGIYYLQYLKKKL